MVDENTFHPSKNTTYSICIFDPGSKRVFYQSCAMSKNRCICLGSVPLLLQWWFFVQAETCKHEYCQYKTNNKMRHIIEIEATITWKWISINLLSNSRIVFCNYWNSSWQLTQSVLCCTWCSLGSRNPVAERLWGPTEAGARSLGGTISVTQNWMSAGFPCCDWPATQSMLYRGLCAALQ